MCFSWLRSDEPSVYLHLSLSLSLSHLLFLFILLSLVLCLFPSLSCLVNHEITKYMTRAQDPKQFIQDHCIGAFWLSRVATAWAIINLGTFGQTGGARRGLWGCGGARESHGEYPVEGVLGSAWGVLGGALRIQERPDSDNT